MSLRDVGDTYYGSRPYVTMTVFFLNRVLSCLSRGLKY